LKRAVVLLSGGLDSAVTLAEARRRGFDAVALTFAYGQRHAREVRSARRVAKSLGVKRHLVLRLPVEPFLGSALTGGRAPRGGRIPATYVPARNTVFLSFAAAAAETIGARDVFIGVNAIDYSGYPDCRPEYVRAMERALRLGTRAGTEGKGIRIHAPLARKTKAEIIRLGTRLGVDLALTHSCYAPVRGRACGECDSCRIRAKGFAEAGIPDPAFSRRKKGC
jgi:7-cyano-7-deazaguanine synthase